MNVEVVTLVLSVDQRHISSFSTEDIGAEELIISQVEEYLGEGRIPKRTLNATKALKVLFNYGYGERFDTPPSPGLTGGMITLIKPIFDGKLPDLPGETNVELD